MRWAALNAIKKFLELFFLNRPALYIWSIVISIACILLSHRVEPMRDILIGIGCSGIAAGFVAIAIDLIDSKNERKKQAQLRRVFLNPLKEELEHILIRLMWLYNALDKIDFEKEIDYFFEPDFLLCSEFILNTRLITFKDYKEEFEQLAFWHSEVQLLGDAAAQSKMRKIFSIVGRAGMPLQSEIDNIKKNELFLISNEFFTPQELTVIIANLDNICYRFGADDHRNMIWARYILRGYEQLCRTYGFSAGTFSLRWSCEYIP